MASKRFTADEIARFTADLRATLTPGSTVSTKVLHVSRSGLSREIGAYIVRDGQIVNISWQVAAIIGARYGDRGGVVLGGAGMDMTFYLVYQLSSRLYPEGHACTGSTGYTPSGKRSKAPRCPSNDHSNDYNRLAREYDAAHPYSETDDTSTLEALGEAQKRRTAHVAARQEWIAAQRTYSRSRTHADGGYALVRVSL